jgi:lipopolysaccharide transport system permease protein
MLIQLAMVFSLFMSGVFWDVQNIENTELVKWLYICNPLLVLVNAYREVLILGQAPDFGALLWVLLESLTILTATLALYRRLNYWLAQRALIQ